MMGGSCLAGGSWRREQNGQDDEMHNGMQSEIIAGGAHPSYIAIRDGGNVAVGAGNGTQRTPLEASSQPLHVVASMVWSLTR